MSNRLNPIHEAKRSATWVLLSLGRELRVARFKAGMTQSQVARVAGRSASWISLIEAGKVPRVAVSELMVVAAAVGMKLYINAYPAGRRPLDGPQLALLADFNARLHPTWQIEVEKVMPKEGDLRAADELISTPTVSCVVEAITRFASVEAQVRAGRLKQRDLRAMRLILLVKGSGANRRMVREAGDILIRGFPIGTREALRWLAAGDDPRGDCLIFL